MRRLRSRVVCALIGHRWILSTHPALRNAPLPIICHRCGHRVRSKAFA